MTPLASTAAAVDARHSWLMVRLGWPEEPAGWTRCGEVDAGFVAAWEAEIAPYVQRTYARTHPVTVSGFLLDWYAGIPGIVGGACFRQARRVPRLSRSALAFHRHPEAHYPDGVALLDERFWCLPDDPEAGHPAATVLPDPAALAGVLRAQVRAHADDFLRGYRGGARLPRRHRLAAFFDGLDTGVWHGGDPSVAAAAEVLASTAAVLPGGTAEFPEASTVHVLTDARGTAHLSRRRLGCCFYYKVTADGRACATCPRVDDTARAVRYAELEG